MLWYIVYSQFPLIEFNINTVKYMYAMCHKIYQRSISVPCNVVARCWPTHIKLYVQETQQR